MASYTWMGGNCAFNTPADWNPRGSWLGRHGEHQRHLRRPCDRHGQQRRRRRGPGDLLFDSTLAVTGGEIPPVSTVSTSNDTLTSPLPELSVSGGQLTIEQGSTIGDLGNADVVGLVQTGGTIVFQNGESANQMSYLAGGWNGANQTSINQQHGTIQVDQGFPGHPGQQHLRRHAGWHRHDRVRRQHDLHVH